MCCRYGLGDALGTCWETVRGQQVSDMRVTVPIRVFIIGWSDDACVTISIGVIVIERRASDAHDAIRVIGIG